MFIAIGTGVPSAAIFHVLTHGMFKALLFLGAGAIIYSVHHEQDMRKMGGLFLKIPITALCCFIGVLAISGVYPLSGYFSKHDIISTVLSNNINGGFLPQEIFHNLHLLIEGLSLVTALYMGRWFALVFLGKYRGSEAVHTVGAIMTIPLVILAFGSATLGLLLEAEIGRFLRELRIPEFIVLDADDHSFMDSFPVLITLVIGITWAQGQESTIRSLGKIRSFFAETLYIDTLYKYMFVKPLRILSECFANSLEVFINGVTSSLSASISAISLFTNWGDSSFEVNVIPREKVAVFVILTLFIILFFVLK